MSLQEATRSTDRERSPFSLEQRDAMHRAELVHRLIQIADAFGDETPASREVDMLQHAACDLVSVVWADCDAGLIPEPPGDWF